MVDYKVLVLPAKNAWENTFFWIHSELSSFKCNSVTAAAVAYIQGGNFCQEQATSYKLQTTCS